MLLRISLIVAIIAGLAAGGLAYVAVSDKIPALAKQRDDEHTGKVTALGDLAKTRTQLKKTEGELATTVQELTDTKGERDKAVARAEAQSKRADELSDKLAKAVSERDEAQNQLASYKATDLTPEQVIKLNKNLKDANNQILAINGEKSVLQRELLKTKAQLNTFIGEDPTIKLRADLHGKIIVVDPKWDFVVLNIGDDQGVVPDGEMLVSRDGKLVAKVIIRSVQKDRSVANIVPGWKMGEMIEGDDVTPAHPAS
jgi:phosphatidylserine/phosphatidylglycerophosphate/cardiolipin synthase-like enzyme